MANVSRSVSVDAVSREIHMEHDKGPFILAPLRFDLVASVVSRLPNPSSSHQLYEDAWRKMGRGHATGGDDVHNTVKRTISRVVGKPAFRLLRLAYQNQRWRFEPELKAFLFIREATESEIGEYRKKGIAETNKRLRSCR